ncbi:MAG: 2-iminoacetate synthase ThiH, partial [Halanaerobiales bacterium]
MGFYQCYQEWKQFDFDGFLAGVDSQDVEEILQKQQLGEEDFLRLLSPAAGDYLEEMARRAHRLTVRNFGRVIRLYAPLYVSNYCDNACLYCGFREGKDGFKRRRLAPEEVAREAEIVADRGIRHILLLTGGSRKHSPVSYIKECVSILCDYFSSVAIEVYALTRDEYEEVIEAGADGLTIYQETYSREVYEQLHPRGPKSDYLFRLEAPERGCRAGMRFVNIGALLGLNDWRQEAFFTGLHAEYLQDNYLATRVGVSVPRLQEFPGGSFTPASPVSERSLVQILLAYRLFLPRVGITVSTREPAKLRNNLLPLGVTKLSAESSTAVGGYSARETEGQFAISDVSSVEKVREMIRSRGYQAV